MNAPAPSPTTPRKGEIAVPVPEYVLRELDRADLSAELALLWNAGPSGRRAALEIADQFNRSKSNG